MAQRLSRSGERGRASAGDGTLVTAGARADPRGHAPPHSFLRGSGSGCFSCGHGDSAATPPAPVSSRLLEGRGGKSIRGGEWFLCVGVVLSRRGVSKGEVGRAYV